MGSLSQEINNNSDIKLYNKILYIKTSDNIILPIKEKYAKISKLILTIIELDTQAGLKNITINVEVINITDFSIITYMFKQLYNHKSPSTIT